MRRHFGTGGGSGDAGAAAWNSEWLSLTMRLCAAFCRQVMNGTFDYRGTKIEKFLFQITSLFLKFKLVANKTKDSSVLQCVGRVIKQ